MNAIRQLSPVFCACLAAAACSGTDDGPEPANCTCGGIVNICRDQAHTGTFAGVSANSLAPAPRDVFVVVDSDGRMRMLGARGMDITGLISSSKCGNVTGTLTAFAQPGNLLADGSDTATTAVRGNADLLSLEFDWQLPGGDTGQFESDFDISKTTRAGQAELVGTWTSLDDVGNATGSFDIDATGSLFGQLDSGCVYSGNVLADGSSTIAIELDVSMCAARDGSYDGIGVSLPAMDGGNEISAIEWSVDNGDAAISDRWTRL